VKKARQEETYLASEGGVIGKRRPTYGLKEGIQAFIPLLMRCFHLCMRHFPNKLRIKHEFEGKRVRYGKERVSG
jgi:hypothetical protein